MSERSRPYIPLAVRVKVAERQFAAQFAYGTPASSGYITLRLTTATLKARVAWLLRIIGIEHPQLDHDPALILRKYNPRKKNIAARYTPNANDPAFLVYREKADHQQKTTGRNPGASRTVTTKGSDIGLKSKFARLEGKTKPKRKTNWPKGRKLQGRGLRK